MSHLMKFAYLVLYMTCTWYCCWTAVVCLFGVVHDMYVHDTVVHGFWTSTLIRFHIMINNNAFMLRFWNTWRRFQTTVAPTTLVKNAIVMITISVTNHYEVATVFTPNSALTVTAIFKLWPKQDNLTIFKTSNAQTSFPALSDVPIAYWWKWPIHWIYWWNILQWSHRCDFLWLP